MAYLDFLLSLFQLSVNFQNSPELVKSFTCALRNWKHNEGLKYIEVLVKIFEVICFVTNP
jgi:hypothetical protein